MGPLDLCFHILSFARPALAVALLVPLAARFMSPGGSAAALVGAHAAINS
jgi:hypothetical protein